MMRFVLFVAMLALAVAPAVPALAQESQIVALAMADMRRLGLPTEGVVLTNAQAGTIHSIANEVRANRSEKRDAVKTVLRRGSR